MRNLVKIENEALENISGQCYISIIEILYIMYIQSAGQNYYPPC